MALATRYFLLAHWVVFVIAQPSGPPPSGTSGNSSGSGKPSGTPPSGSGGNSSGSGKPSGTPPSGSGSSSGAPSGGSAATCSNPSCASPPCDAPLLNDVGCTTVSGQRQYEHELYGAGSTIASNAHIFGPFEAGFGERQQSIIEGWGITDATCAYDEEGGTDIGTAEQAVAYKCDLAEFPRISGTSYVGLVDSCGGHTSDYHFHVKLSCLYTESGGHSTEVGNVAQYKLYGKWENAATNQLPYLDACGAHFGPTPSSSEHVYHYHVQDKAPFTVGCYGPDTGNTLMSVARCRALYPGSDKGCNRNAEVMTLKTGSIQYTRWCPCYDADGKNSLPIVELPALSTSEISYTSSSSGGAPAAAPASSSPAPATASRSSVRKLGLATAFSLSVLVFTQ